MVNSLCFATFYNRPEDQFIVVGTAKDLQLAPRRCTEGYLHVYRIVDGGKRLEFFHKVFIFSSVVGLLRPTNRRKPRMFLMHYYHSKEDYWQEWVIH